MNAVTNVPVTKSVTRDMAVRYGMETESFERTVRATCFPTIKESKKVVGVRQENYREASKEEFAAFLLVAKEYSLNPLLREIYAFPRKGGGIVPIVSVDGWIHLVNGHPQMDGMEFEEHNDEKGRLVSITCRIWRKDRKMPVVITEYLDECFRENSEAWKMPRRMLRHKSLIQCARIAFGFSGVYDEDEAEKISAAPSVAAPPAPARGEVIDVTPNPVPSSEISAGAGKPEAETVADSVTETAESAATLDEEKILDQRNGVLSDLDASLADATSLVDLDMMYNEIDVEALLSNDPEGVDEARLVKATHIDRIKKLAQQPAAPTTVELIERLLAAADEHKDPEVLATAWRQIVPTAKKELAPGEVAAWREKIQQKVWKLQEDAEGQESPRTPEAPPAPPPPAPAAAPAKTEAPKQDKAPPEPVNTVGAFETAFTWALENIKARDDLVDWWIKHKKGTQAGASPEKLAEWTARYVFRRDELKKLQG